MKSLELQALYSYTPCQLGYCGPRTFPPIFEKYVRGEIGQQALKHELDKFIVPSSYRDLIAKYNDADPYSYEVVEALWIGNEMLDNVPDEALRNFIRMDLVKAGLKKERAEKLASELPLGMTTHHSFHTLYIQFVSEKVPRNIDSFDKCRIGWGKIVSESESCFELEYVPLLLEGKEFRLGRRSKKIKRGFVKEARVGDLVSTHWNSAVQIITRRQAANLEKYTKKTIDAINLM